MGHEEKVLDVVRGTLEKENVLVVRTGPQEDFQVAIHFLRVTGRLVVEDVQETLNSCVPGGKYQSALRTKLVSTVLHQDKKPTVPTCTHH